MKYLKADDKNGRAPSPLKPAGVFTAAAMALGGTQRGGTPVSAASRGHHLQAKPSALPCGSAAG